MTTNNELKQREALIRYLEYLKKKDEEKTGHRLDVRI
jgi:hypothetical protein